jgi:hypothetical protein
MRTFFSNTIRHIRRRGQVGQSLIILALGFIALIGFVGIVTDVSLLFVRYSSLRRAVDAAAVAAAGQFRRVADDGAVMGEAASLAQLTLAARQFIELYGLNPNDVLVETCRAQRVPRDGAGNPVLTDPEVRARYEQLCTNEELKLVRVTAQIASPTVFLRLLGQPSILLTESAISQTAVIDVVLVFDVSESMLNETRDDDWAVEGYTNIYVPPAVPYSNPEPWNTLLSQTHVQHQTTFTADLFDAGSNLIGTAARIYDSGGGLVSPGSDPLRSECRWFAWPSNTWHGGGYIPVWLMDKYRTVMSDVDIRRQFFMDPSADVYDLTWRRFTGFQPTYNYFGCCNDPNGDMNFDDLVCQPFRDARDAAEQFLARLDFLRGDRVSYVTFDRGAHLVDPDGEDATTRPQPPMIETEFTLDPDGAGPITIGHPQYREGAVEVLRRVIGVRAEPSFYADGSPTTQADNDGRWDSIRDYSRTRTYSEMRNAITQQIFDYPVAFACPFDQAVLEPMYTNINQLPDGTAAPADYRLLDSIMTTPRWFRDVNDIFFERLLSYEYIASCAGTNIGGAMARASNALFFNGRREGAVWMMVMLSDGAAGASNPVSRDGTTLPGRAQPFAVNSGGFFDPLRGVPPDLTDLTPPQDINPPAGYGAFGLCPYGTQADPGELLDLAAPDFGTFPYCSDEDPSTRNFCSDLAAVPDLQAMDAYTGCIENYDVDDYARDWADWVGLANISAVGAGGTRTGEQQLPTIFTIGYGLDFDRRNAVGVCPGDGSLTPPETKARWDCMRANNVADNLGEELLRYIADVGDNFRMDDDYWQSYPVLRDGRLPNPVPNPLDPNADWGPRGACQLSVVRAATTGYPNPQTSYTPFAPTEDCGNYFNAPSGAELNVVFNEIASRMFTRLTQ